MSDDTDRWLSDSVARIIAHAKLFVPSGAQRDRVLAYVAERAAIADRAQTAAPPAEAAPAPRFERRYARAQDRCPDCHSVGTHYCSGMPESAQEDDAIRAAAYKLMMWPLPRDFSPDCGISFDGRKDDEWNKNKSWPVGTNLFNVDQARAMFAHCIGDTIASLRSQLATEERDFNDMKLRREQAEAWLVSMFGMRDASIVKRGTGQHGERRMPVLCVT